MKPSVIKSKHGSDLVRHEEPLSHLQQEPGYKFPKCPPSKSAKKTMLMLNEANLNKSSSQHRFTV